MNALRLGTRASSLAMTQSQTVADAITAATGQPVELVQITTKGDVNSSPLTQLGGTGVFVSALRQALLDNQIDVAVHSLKDLPTAPAEGIAQAAVPVREDPRDALVARDGLTLGELPSGSVIGTGSPRRVAQLAALDLGVQLQGLRGNVDTRLAAVSSGTYDAVVLAAAGLRRLGRDGEITELLDPIQMLPAPGQGALAVECRADDAETLAVLAGLEHQPTRACVTAERAVLAGLEAGCSAPVGALAEWAEGDDGPELYLRAIVATLDGSAQLRRSLTGAPEQAAELGRRLAELMLEDGAAELISAASEYEEPEVK